MKITVKNCINTVNLTSKQKLMPVNNYYETPGNNDVLVPNISPIYFTSNTKIPDDKILIPKLMKFIDDLLATKNPEESSSDLVYNAITKAIKIMKNREKAIQRLEEEVLALTQNKILNPQQKFSRARELKKELEKIDKVKFIDYADKKVTKKSNFEENLDYILLNKFKSAITANDYQLDKIYKNYYSPLNEIKTVNELKEKFPKIQLIKNPAEVVANKIADNITRDFYEEFDPIFRGQDNKAILDYLRNFIEKLYESYADKLDVDIFCEKIAEPLVNAIFKKYDSILLNKSFSIIPEYRKNLTAVLSKDDLDLLKVDYDDFVTFVTRQIYVEGKKPGDITYKFNGIEIPIGKINDTNYKFKKPLDKIKKILNDSREIENSRRAYEFFDINKFQERLNYYANSDFAINDRILESLISFSSCKFEKEDIEQLIKLLRELDKSKDGKISIEEVAKNITRYDIKPRGTQRLNRIELERLEQEIKAKQKDASKLSYIQENFDNTMNILYMHDMNELVDICSTYRPTNLKSNPDSDFVMDLVSEHIADNKIINQDILERKLLRWDSYKTYSEIDSDNPIFKRALEYANGDEIKAGQYIINSEIVQSYPQLPKDYPYEEILEKLFEKICTDIPTDNERNLITKYLCKLEDCMNMPEKERRLISNLLEKFELNDDINKILLKYVFENDYLKNKTKINITDTNRTAVLDIKAKQKIYDTYKYPNSLYLIRQFEEAMVNFTGPKGTAGIKHLGIHNDSLKGYYEVKIMGNNGDRLETSKISDTEEIIFDTFIPKGRH